ncbi:MAG: hypothetical protein MHM6MM_006807 [Cercozoa sp. M6MM]
MQRLVWAAAKSRAGSRSASKGFAGGFLDRFRQNVAPKTEESSVDAVKQEQEKESVATRFVSHAQPLGYGESRAFVRTSYKKLKLWSHTWSKSVPVDEALLQLWLSKKRYARQLRTAVMRARDEAIAAGHDPAKLVVHAAMIGPGPRKKSVSYRGRGKVDLVQHRTSVVIVRVGQTEAKNKQEQQRRNRMRRLRLVQEHGERRQQVRNKLLHIDQQLNEGRISQAQHDTLREAELREADALLMHARQELPDLQSPDTFQGKQRAFRHRSQKLWLEQRRAEMSTE